MVVYPITLNLVARAPNAWLFRPYIGAGGGAYRWKSKVGAGDGGTFAYSGWNLGLIPTVGIEYYLRPKVAFDVGLRYHYTGVPASGADPADGNLRFIDLWIGHYVRF